MFSGHVTWVVTHPSSGEVFFYNQYVCTEVQQVIDSEANLTHRAPNKAFCMYTKVILASDFFWVFDVVKGV